MTLFMNAANDPSCSACDSIKVGSGGQAIAMLCHVSDDNALSTLACTIDLDGSGTRADVQRQAISCE